MKNKYMYKICLVSICKICWASEQYLAGLPFFRAGKIVSEPDGLEGFYRRKTVFKTSIFCLPAAIRWKQYLADFVY